MIQGLSHITLVVRDLDRAGAFLRQVFDAEQVYASGDDTFSISRERFYMVGDLWFAIMEGEPHGERTYDHVALKIADEDFDTFELRVREAGFDCRASRPRVKGEGRSLYFHDHDNHLFELHTGTLVERLETYARLTRPDSNQTK